MKLYARLVSWLKGHYIGETRYIKASPFIVSGNLNHILPFGCWTDEEKAELRYCAYKQQWNGFNWVFVERCEFTEFEWKQIL